MEDNSDDGRYVLPQGKTSPEDWIQRGNIFMDKNCHDLAAHCFTVAKDPVRRTFAAALACGLDLRMKIIKDGRRTPEQELQFFKVN